MPSPIRIHHPMKDDQKDESNIPLHFAAFGFADAGVTKIKGKLVRDKDGLEVQGTILVQPEPFWLISFSAPEAVAPTLEEVHRHNEDKWHLVVSDELHQGTKASFGGITLRRPGFGVQIDYPHKINNAICQNFAAYGFADLAHHVEGSIDGNTWVQESQSPPHWIIRFSNVPTGGPYTLKVQNTANSSDAQSSAELEVAASCT
jgi:hypothetical protein